MTPEEEKRFEIYALAARDRKLFFNGRQLPYKTALTSFAKKLRSSQTECELRLGAFLKKLPYKVRPQHPIDGYIVDFYIPALHLVVEVDGEQHISGEGKEYDANRDAILRMYQLEVLRISNVIVRSDFNNACDMVRNKISEIEYERRALPPGSP